ncbi:tetratricopeptide repeat protein [Actinomadura sp. 7K507]|uniref:tetratricopeptide repeat protein n=1 Tax=Actinomadura sp. 7K507 TaxID=2530365 RepID=UPI0014044152|nr:tetratricopeptide repeat protein [Actinomadura sp. 7K507]
MAIDDVPEIDEWLLEPPDARLPPPPVVTQAAELPISALTWENAERLFVRLLQETQGPIQFAKRFGTQGQRQGGIDAYARFSLHAPSPEGRIYLALQSRRVKKLTPTGITSAVDEFLAGEWASRTTKFFFATSFDLRERSLDAAVRRAADKLAEHGIEFVPWGAQEVADLLRSLPETVEDFFGPPWVVVFCRRGQVRVRAPDPLPLPGSRRRRLWRRAHGHGPLGLALHLKGGQFPLVREVDAIELGVKPAIGTYEVGGAARALPPYVTRDGDKNLEDFIRAGGLTIVRGRRAVGKTRTAIEVLRRVYPSHRLVVPRDGRALRELVVTGLGEDAVVWLDGLDNYLSEDGLDLALVQYLHPTPIVATMADDEFSKREHNRQLPPHHAVGVAQNISESERKGLSRRASDDWRIHQAMGGPEGFGEYLAAGHALLRQWTIGDGPLFEVGQALISAAVDCRRAGCDEPVPAEVLARLYQHYLPASLRDRADLPSVEDGLRWASQCQLGASSCLKPLIGKTYRAADYLLDAALEGAGPLSDPPALVVWSDVLDLIPATDAVVVGFHALLFGELNIAENAFHVGTDSDDVDAMMGCGMLAVLRNDTDTAVNWFSLAAELSHPDAMANLAVLAEERGDQEAASKWHERAATTGRLESMVEYALLLYDSGTYDAVEDWFERIAAIGGGAAIHDLGVRFAERGDLKQAEMCLHRALIDLGQPETMYSLGLVSKTSGDTDKATEWFQRAAESGHIRAMYNLAVLLRQRDEVVLALEWYRKAAEGGLPEAMYALGYLWHERGDQNQAETWRMRAAKAGHGPSAFDIGADCMARGDVEEAVSWWRQAAHFGNAGAMYRLGQLDHEQDDEAGAQDWWQRAARAGHVEAMTIVGGRLYLDGDAKYAEMWLERAAEYGHADAAFALGEIRHTNSPEQAVPWYTRAAKMGHHEAILRLSSILTAEGNEELARPWLHAAAELGDTISMADYGILRWQDGDLTEAIRWLRQAAKQDNVDAMTRLGIILNEQQRAKESEYWWRRAAAIGDPLGQYLLGSYLRQTGQPSEAEPLLRQAAEAGLSFAISELADLRQQHDETGLSEE